MHRTIEIDGKKIGDGYPTYIVCEVGINHNGDLLMAKKMIDIAASSGVDAIKFQMRDLNAIYREEDLNNPNLHGQGMATLIGWLKKFDVSHDFYYTLNDWCLTRNITFLCTAFDLNSLRFLENNIGVSAHKIGSPCLSDIFMIEEIIKYRKPIILSTGMHRMDEVSQVIRMLQTNDSKFALMHCVSNYPVNFNNIHMDYIDMYKKRFDVPVGYSGHEKGIVIAASTVAAGANIIEKHFTLDTTLIGPDHPASIEPEGLGRLVKYIRHIERAKRPIPENKVNPGEMINKETLGKSLVAVTDIQEGEIITKEKLCAKCHGLGISPLQINSIVNRTATEDIFKDEIISYDKLENVSSYVQSRR